MEDGMISKNKTAMFWQHATNLWTYCYAAKGRCAQAVIPFRGIIVEKCWENGRKFYKRKCTNLALNENFWRGAYRWRPLLDTSSVSARSTKSARGIQYANRERVSELCVYGSSALGLTDSSLKMNTRSSSMGCGLCPCAALNDTRLSVSLVNQGQGTTSCIIQLPKFDIQHVINFLPCIRPNLSKQLKWGP